MTTENLFEAIGGIHDELLEQTEHAKKAVWKIWVPIAACLGAAILAVAIFLWFPKESPETILPPPANGNWTLNFSTGKNIQAQSAALPVYFKDKMDSAEIELVLPANRPDWLTATGHCEFGKEKDPLCVYLELKTSIPYAPIHLYISVKPLFADVIHESGISECNGVTFYSAEYQISYGLNRLETRAQINGYHFLFWTEINPESAERVKVDYKQVLESFTYYAEPDKPQLSSITCGKELEIYRKMISIEKAREDADYGTYIPAATPEGTTEVTAKRIGGDLGLDGLEVCWGTEDGWIEWSVYRYERQSHCMRMVSALDTYGIDSGTLAICPAEDMTVEMLLRKFYSIGGVKYKDVVILFDLSSDLKRDLSRREWICEQLAALGIIEAEGIRVDRRGEIGGYDMFITDTGLQNSPWVEHIPRLEVSHMSYYQYSSDRREFLELQYWEQREKLRSLTLRFTHYDGQLLTDVADKEKYELSLCWNPWDPYIPEQDRIHMEKPVFDAEDLTDDVLNARIYNDYRFDRQQKKYYAEPRMEFGIRIGDVVIYVFASNMTAEEVLEIVELM